MKSIAQTHKLRRAKYSPAVLERVKHFRRGLIWHVSRCLETTKRELWGDKHDLAAGACRDLTFWLSEIQRWSDHHAAGVMQHLNRRVPHLVKACIEEGADFDRQLMGTFETAAWPRKSAA